MRALRAAAGVFVLLAAVHSAGAATPMTGISRIFTGYGHACAIDAGAAVWCWGDNEVGQVGDGTDKHRIMPLKVPGLAGGVTSLALGNSHTCALMVNGTVRCWGQNQDGQLGDSSNTSRFAPTVVPSLAGIKAIAAGSNHTCALESGGGVLCWGSNIFGALGIGSQTPVNAPARVAGLLAGVASISAGGNHVCVVMETGLAKCWGENLDGELGDGTRVNRPAPVDVKGLSGVSSISAGFLHTCAVVDERRAYCWGNNASVALGLGNVGTAEPQVEPTRVAGGYEFFSISAGAFHTCAVTRGGDGKCWGNGYNGELGNDSRFVQFTPVDVLRAPGAWRSISAGNQFSCGLTFAGAVHCWGYNIYGQLGEGTVAPHRTPSPAYFPGPGKDAGRIQDLWWSGPAENGWGMTITEHHEMLFAGLFVYDTQGAATWMVMPGGAWNADKSVFEGDLYEPRGSPWYAYDAAQMVAGAPVGTLRLAFSSTEALTAQAIIRGTTTVKQMVREVFATPMLFDSYLPTDLWWGGLAQNGWGVAVTSQGSNLFAVWYTYDATGKPTWYVMPDARVETVRDPPSFAIEKHFRGDLYATRGSPWSGATYSPSALQVTRVGTLWLDFDDVMVDGTMTATVNGDTRTTRLVRQPF